MSRPQLRKILRNQIAGIDINEEAVRVAAFSLYLARRFEFGGEYLNCIEAVRKAGIAKAKGDRETQAAELENAVESLYSALSALAAVARSNCDRGVIAVLNEYGYRPLKKELESLQSD